MKKSNKKTVKQDWGAAEPSLSPEEVILWLDGYRQMMFEVWKNNPELRKEWERLNSRPTKSKRPSRDG